MIIYFAAQLEFSDDWYVLGSDTASSVSYLTLFQGEKAQERAEEYCKIMNEKKTYTRYVK